MSRIKCSVIAFAILSVFGALERPEASAASYLVVDGEVATPLALSEVDFRALPRTSVTVKDSGGHDAAYEGVDLSELLHRAGVPLQDDLKGADVAKYLHVEGSDAFAAVVSLPEFDRSSFLVADTLNGSPLAADSGPLQLISPDEKRHSRWIKHLTLVRTKKSQR